MRVPFVFLAGSMVLWSALPSSPTFWSAIPCSAQAHAAQAVPRERPSSQEKLGTVNFNTSCSPAVQVDFNRAVALMHSFQFARAIEGFQAVLAKDPACSMADWGIALSNWGNPFAAGQKSERQVEQGRRAVEQARAAKPKTEREAAYIEAVAHLFIAAPNQDQRTRVLAYESAMAAIHAKYPEDTEAAIFYALAMAAAADPADKSYARQAAAGRILEALYVRYPDHPGLAHYIIHAYDAPALAARAEGAAKHYSEIAPESPHALHMPSHIFTRLGEWQASIDANLASAVAARKAGQPADELHATDYEVYAYLQTAQDGAARRGVEAAAEIFSRFNPAVEVGGAGGPQAAYFAHAAIPARYALERRAWEEASKLEPTASPFAQTEAITQFARGLGAAHLKDSPAAHAAIEALEQCHDRLDKKNESYWANQVQIQRQEVLAWLALAEGGPADAIAKMREAAAWEDKTEKSAVTPGPLVPAHEQLGDMLLEMGRAGDALKEYEATLKKEPNRFWALYGAAQAAKRGGDGRAQQTYLRQLLKVTERADEPARRELVEARSESKRSASLGALHEPGN